jgi:hypothetical protein
MITSIHSLKIVSELFHILFFIQNVWNLQRFSIWTAGSPQLSDAIQNFFLLYKWHKTNTHSVESAL